MRQKVFRFAPSPNGYLHLGHAYSALLNQRAARRVEGRLLLRIEDIDVSRARPEFEQAILEDLTWLGVAYDGPPRRQSDHFSDYALALERLQAQDFTYPCFCTRGEIAAVVDGRSDWPRSPDGAPLYPGTCRTMTAQEQLRRMSSGQHGAQRLNGNRAVSQSEGPLGWREWGEGNDPRDVNAEPWRWGDVVVGRKDVPASYHLAVVVDDAAQGVTDVVRGADLFDATSLHRLLQEALGLPAPDYHHHRLIPDGEGRKLSKSEGARALRDLRAEGVTAQDVRRELGFGED